jgi:hypothetical protein
LTQNRWESDPRSGLFLKIHFYPIFIAVNIHMKTIPFKLLMLFSIFSCWNYQNYLQAQPAQEKKKPEASKDKPQGLYFIHDKLDTSKYRYITRILIKGAEGRATIQELYYNLRKKALDAGGNGYKKPVYNVANNTLQAEVYSLTESGLHENIAFEEPNSIYIFGRERSTNKKLTFYVNEEKKQLKGGTYYKYIIPEEKNVQISKGGPFNSPKIINWKPGGATTYIALSGVQIIDPQISGPNNLAISPGNMMLIEQGLGQLYMRLLKPMLESEVNK